MLRPQPEGSGDSHHLGVTSKLTKADRYLHGSGTRAREPPATSTGAGPFPAVAQGRPVAGPPVRAQLWIDEGGVERRKQRLNESRTLTPTGIPRAYLSMRPPNLAHQYQVFRLDQGALRPLGAEVIDCWRYERMNSSESGF
jgi:hypothetical protein